MAAACAASSGTLGWQGSDPRGCLRCSAEAGWSLGGLGPERTLRERARTAWAPGTPASGKKRGLFAPAFTIQLFALAPVALESARSGWSAGMLVADLAIGPPPAELPAGASLPRPPWPSPLLSQRAFPAPAAMPEQEASGHQEGALQTVRERAKKKLKFTPPPPRPKPSRPPSIGSLVLAVASPKQPSDDVRAKIGHCNVLAGIDVETHGWTDEESVGGRGQFGFYCICPPAKLQARVVQLGWVVGNISGEPVRKERIVRPVGFRVEEKAARFHGISHERAESEGSPLAQVLAEFLDDMLAARRAGGRLVSHHLEFDAGILSEEIDRAGLTCRKQEWEAFVREGFCTMDPAVGTWLRECSGMQIAPELHKNIMRLPAMVDALRPYQRWPPWKHHAAGDDARVHFAIYGALVELLNQADASRSIF